MPKQVAIHVCISQRATQHRCGDAPTRSSLGAVSFSRSARFAGRDVLPGFIKSANGCRITDVDGRSYIDFNCGNGPNLLGYRHPEIEAVAQEQAAESDLASFYNPAMVDYAERLIQWSETMHWVIPVKNGSDATNLAIRHAIIAPEADYLIHLRLSRLRRKSHCSRSTVQQYHAQRTAPAVERPFCTQRSHHNTWLRCRSIMMNPLTRTRLRRPERPIRRSRCDRQFRNETGALVAVDDVRNGFRLHARDHIGTWESTPICSVWAKRWATDMQFPHYWGKRRCEGVEQVQLTATYMFSAVAHRVGIAVLDIYERDDALSHMQDMGQRLIEG